MLTVLLMVMVRVGSSFGHGYEYNGDGGHDGHGDGDAGGNDYGDSHGHDDCANDAMVRFF